MAEPPDSTQPPDVSPDDSVSMLGARNFVTLDNASITSSRSSRVSARQAKARELELAAKLRALDQKRELEERRRRLQLQCLEVEEEEIFSMARDKAAKLRRQREFEQEEDQIRHLQAEIDIKADYDAARAIHELLQEESMTPDSLSVKSLINLDRHEGDSRRPTDHKWADVTTSIHKLRDIVPARSAYKAIIRTQYESRIT